MTTLGNVLTGVGIAVVVIAGLYSGRKRERQSLFPTSGRPKSDSESGRGGGPEPTGAGVPRRTKPPPPADADQKEIPKQIPYDNTT
jgi:hypothetical protein